MRPCLARKRSQGADIRSFSSKKPDDEERQSDGADDQRSVPDETPFDERGDGRQPDRNLQHGDDECEPVVTFQILFGLVLQKRPFVFEPPRLTLDLGLLGAQPRRFAPRSLFRLAPKPTARLRFRAPCS